MLADKILELLYPPRCVICRQFLPDGKPRVCQSCWENLPRTTDGGRKHGDFFSECVSPMYYENELREAILRYKFGGKSCYAPAFGEMLADCIYRELEGRYELVTWVPLDRRRLRARGYDQAQLLAQNVCGRLCVEPVRLLKKEPGVKAQSGTGSPERRKANIAGAYTALNPAAVAGKRILIIDDIITTGSTLSECAKTLLLAGADEVLCAALARTK